MSPKKLMIVGVITCALACSLALTGCNSTTNTPAEETSGYSFNKGAVTVKDKTVTVELEGNPTTGFQWTDKLDGDSIVKKDETYVSSGKGTTTGAGGTYTFTYEGTKAGVATINYIYARSWESTGTEDTITITVTTDDTGKVTDSDAICSDNSRGKLN